MFVLTLRKGEVICIGDRIVLNVNDGRAGRVWLGIPAPEDVTIDREKIWERKRKRTTLKQVEQNSGIAPCTE
jgi:carbon storage regulator CsrA